MMLVKPVIFGILTIMCYCVVVIITTPGLAAGDAIRATLQMNFIVIAGLGFGVGLQIYLSEKGKIVGCNVKHSVYGGNSGGAAAASFFSFFSLVPLGCCGWWLYVLSLLPSLFGTGMSAILIEYSQPLAYVGLAIIFCFNILTACKLRRIMRVSIQSNL